MNSRLGIGAALVALSTCFAACASHGEYTSASQDEAQQKILALHAGTDYDLALQQFMGGDIERALETVDGSIAKNDAVGISHLLRGRTLIELGRAQASLAALERGSEIEPDEPEFDYYRGIVLEQLGDFEGAYGAYLRAAELDSAKAHYRLAAVEVLVELDRLDDARALLALDTGEFTSEPGYLQALGHIELLDGDLDAAEQAFSDAVVLSAGDPVMLEDLCRVQVALGEFAQAESTLARLTKEEGYEERFDLKRLHASFLLELQRPVEARVILLELTRAADGAHDIEAWNGLVDAALMMSDDRLLRAAADRLLAAGPDRHEGYLALAMWQRRTGDLDAALTSARAAVARAGDDPTPSRLETLIDRQIRAQGSPD